MFNLLTISIPLIVGLLLLGLSCYVLGLVFKDEFLYHHDQWISDGKPTIGFWIPSPESCASFKSFWAGGKYQIKWLFSTPLWIRNNKKTFFKLWAYRTLVTLGFVIFTLYLILLKL
jgi:hypothetical protein